MSSSINFWISFDVYKDIVTVAVFRNPHAEPLPVDRPPYDLRKLRRYFQRLQLDGNVHACYEASGAGYISAGSVRGPPHRAVGWPRRRM